MFARFECHNVPVGRPADHIEILERGGDYYGSTYCYTCKETVEFRIAPRTAETLIREGATPRFLFEEIDAFLGALQ